MVSDAGCGCAVDRAPAPEDDDRTEVERAAPGRWSTVAAMIPVAVGTARIETALAVTSTVARAPPVRTLLSQRTSLLR
jgi:hypothetical protein